MTSTFAKYTDEAWPYRFHGTITARNLAGGTPTDPKVAEGWLRTKLVDNRDDLIRDMVSEVMVERGVSADEAAEIVDMNKHLNGFKKHPDKGLYIEGRQLKAAIKEAASVAAAAGKIPMQKWGKTNKYIFGFVAEHIQVVDELLYLGVDQPSRIIQSFPKNSRTGKTGIQYTEVIDEATFDFTVISDHKFADKDWAMLWLTGEQQGIGATRSQGYGRYEVTRWEAA